jgi:DNA-binding GntR family transcriptional regulator
VILHGITVAHVPLLVQILGRPPERMAEVPHRTPPAVFNVQPHEVEALRQAILCGDVAWEARVVAAQYTLERFETSLVQETTDSIMAWETANRDFHLAMISGCPVRRLVRFTEHLYDQVMRYRHRTTLRRSFPRHGLSHDHLSIVQSTLQRDSETACAALVDHIESIARQAEKSIFGTQAV